MKQPAIVLTALMLFLSASADSIEFRRITLGQKLQDAVHFEISTVSDHVVSFRPYSIDGKEYLTLHKYAVENEKSGGSKPICTNTRIPVGTKLVLIREKKPLPNEPRDLAEALTEQCEGHSYYYDASFGYELLRVEDVYHKGQLKEFVVLDAETYKVEDEENEYLERTQKVESHDGEIVFAKRELLVPLKWLSQYGSTSHEK